MNEEMCVVKSKALMFNSAILTLRGTSLQLHVNKRTFHFIHGNTRIQLTKLRGRIKISP